MKKIENMRMRKSEDLCKLAEMLGYRSEPYQLQCNNGAYVSSLLHFLDDNPGALEAIQNWILENEAAWDIEEDEDEEEEIDEES